MTFQKYLNSQRKRAEKASLEPEAIKLLVLELSEMDGATFYSNLNSPISDELKQKLDDAINLYIDKKIPVQHIIGYSYFYGYKFEVSDKVLIPRPETEELVGYVLQTFDEVFTEKRSYDVVDVGTGSGAIAIALSKEEPSFNMIATDISKEALEVAKRNSLKNDANVEFIEGDMLEPLIKESKKFDILVSNPPYIPNEEFVEDIVKNNEPNVALFGGIEGMDFYNIILSNAKKILKEKSIIAFEHSHTKKTEMVNLSKQHFPNAEIRSIKDLNGKDRFTIIINRWE